MEAHLTASDESPLEHIRRRLALAVGEDAVFDGWTRAAVDAAAETHGISPEQAQLAMPDSPAGLIGLYIQAVDRELESRCPPDLLATLKIRERIRLLVWTRLEIMTPARESVRRALAILAMPQNLALAARSGWRSADHMWRLAGDSSTDFNHYTKRATLGAVYTATLLAWLNDASEGATDTAAFLDRRIDDVMAFEKWKAGWRATERPSLTRFLGRLRYPPR
jgi:ubiquinone biosynthesis protein COQ9